MVITIILQLSFPLRRCAWLYCLLICGLLLAGCNKSVSSSGLQGTWIPDKASLAFLKATNFCQIVLQGDNSFIGTVPDYLMKTFDQCSGQVMIGKGQWLASTEWLETQIKLNFTEVD